MNDYGKQLLQVVDYGKAGEQDAELTPEQVTPRWTARDVADYLKIAPKRVYELDIPQIRLGERTIRYDPEDVFAWEQKRKSRGMR